MIMKEHDAGKAPKATSVYCVEDLLNKSGGGCFGLMRIVMLRARELDCGKPSLLENFRSDKVVTIAFEEVLQGKVARKKSPKVAPAPKEGRS